jgi:uncharacterized Zn-finger protein
MIKSHSPSPTPLPVKCEVCGKTFGSDKLMKHQIKVHSVPILNYFCEVCPKSFPDKPKLNRHTATHSTETPYICDKCGNAYVSKHYLHNHYRYTHLGVKHYLQVKEREIKEKARNQEELEHGENSLSA